MSLAPRKYQEELFDYARQRNTIIVADTGTGKTFVAVSLIRHFSEMPVRQEDHSRRLICLVVPTVELVTQQATYISGQLPLKVAKFSSAEGVDCWQDEKWCEKIAAAEVIVMTSAILQKMLEHGYVSITDITLLIFDEAHHTRKNHPNNQIMNIYHRYRQEHGPLGLPHILGMTASPIHRANDAARSIKILEENLDATMVEVKLHKPDLLAATQRPKITYLMHGQATPSKGYLASHPDVYNEFISRLEEKEAARFQRIGEEMGGLAQDLLALVHLEEHRASATRAQAGGGSHVGLHSQLMHHTANATANSFNTQPKVLDLLDHLEQNQELAASESMLIFVTQRDHCVVLARLLSLCNRLSGFLRVSWLVGQASTGGNERRMKGRPTREQREVMARFRTGALNCLVVTQVAEEGLDFPACSLVVRYDLPKTLTSLIQSRGRARAAQSHLVLFCKDYNERVKIERFLEAEIASKSFYGQSRDGMDKDSVSDDDEDYDTLGVYRPSSTIPSQITASSAVRLVHETCQLLPADEFTVLHRPSFKTERLLTGFRSTLSLPRMRWLGHSERVIEGVVQRSEKLARAQVAFEAVKLLHRRGALDDHLMPVRVLDKAERLDANGHRCDPIPTVNQPKVVPAESSNPFGSLQGPLYLNVIDFTCGASKVSFGIICGAPLSNVETFRFNLDDGTAATTSVHYAGSLPWDASSSEFPTLWAFTHKLLQGLGERTHDPQSSPWYLIAPLTSNMREVDWSAVHGIAPTQPPSPSGIILWAQSNRRLRPTRFVELVRSRPDLALDDPISADTPMFMFQNRLHKFSSLRAWFEGGSNTPGPGLCSGTLPEKDEIVEVNVLKLPRPWIHQSQTPLPSGKTRAVLPASILVQPHFTKPFLVALLALPVVTHHIFSQIMVRNALRTLNLQEEIPTSFAMQALTAPECSCGRDYETLEHVGDAFLKLAVTIHVFNNFEDEEEGFLSKIRSNTTDNRILQKQAMACHLEQHLVTLRFSASHIDPPVFAPTADPEGSRIKFEVRGKALADAMEACLGAALTSNGIDASLSAAHKLGLSVGGPLPWSMRYTTLPPCSLQSSASVTELENLLGYSFKHPSLLIDALRHRSAVSQVSRLDEACYERLEFLGDAVIDLFITMLLYSLHPDATAGQLTNLRAILVSNGSLGHLAIERLGLHKRVLHHSPSLTAHFDLAAQEAGPTFAQNPYYKAVWFWDPVKVLCDVFESVIGAILVDCDWDVTPIFNVLGRLFSEVAAALSLDSPPDPWSLLQQKRPPGCKKLEAIVLPRAADEECECEVVWHGSRIGFASHASRSVAKFQAADVALQHLAQTWASQEALNAACTCAGEEDSESQGLGPEVMLISRVEVQA